MYKTSKTTPLYFYATTQRLMQLYTKIMRNRLNPPTQPAVSVPQSSHIFISFQQQMGSQQIQLRSLDNVGKIVYNEAVNDWRFLYDQKRDF